ncbi:hypothetical protein FA13DRAFT_1054889 [Coprinellus micaceus]|uniref:MYND-type domain-containing protein n=1 Tax=Coprinellus micaceus TaxID=71717 RepID=A0A4Y7SWX5_COPMI|nr:hypothetical protein FA13DRAFT_1054889 [Coprinellus micaceus]
MAFWTHLAEPRAVFYIHHLCATGSSQCHTVIKEQEAMMASVTGAPLSRGITDRFHVEPDQPCPLASSCANCNDDKTASEGYRMSRCGGCKLTRYCCPGCQKADWSRHKKTCKIVESVKWENWPGTG